MNRTVLAFDFGHKRIGIAVGQEITGTARPLTALDTKNNRIDWNRIAQLLHTWHPDVLVVGLPLNMDGTEQSLTAAARRFARQLHGRFATTVDLVDERLSSRAADWLLKEQGKYRHALRSQRDPLAAQLILETWFAEQKHTADANR